LAGGGAGLAGPGEVSLAHPSDLSTVSVAPMNDSSSSRRWIVYAIPAAIAASAIAWAIALPREVCVSGSDNQVCSDNTYVKWTIALVGIALALIVVGIILFIRRVRHGRALARGV
jgi:hypothetical protein